MGRRGWKLASPVGSLPHARATAPAKDPGTRMTSLEPVTSDTVATRVSFRFPAGEDRPASLIAHVHPNHSDNGWNWYSGYTVELDPQAQKVRLLAAHRANKHQELGAGPVRSPAMLGCRSSCAWTAGNWWCGLAERDVITCQPERLLPPGHFGITARGRVQIRDLAVGAGRKPVALRPNPLLTTPGDALSLRWARVQTGTAEVRLPSIPKAGIRDCAASRSSSNLARASLAATMRDSNAAGWHCTPGVTTRAFCASRRLRPWTSSCRCAAPMAGRSSRRRRCGQRRARSSNGWRFPSRRLRRT